MTAARSTESQARARRAWQKWLATGLVATLGIAACGGGGSDVAGPVGSGGTGSYASGPISGFGSVIVNGVRYDDSQAVVRDEDGEIRSSDDLKLGMVVEVEGSEVAADDRGVLRGEASEIRYDSELEGPVTAVDAVAGTLSVLGQPVSVDSKTVFDSSLTGGLAVVTVGTVVEVDGYFDSTTNRFRATRIEREDDADDYKLRGIVAGLDTTAKQFTLGGETISYSGLANTDVPAALANGADVKVKLRTAQVNGAWVVTQLRVLGARQLPDVSEAEVEGLITEFTSVNAFKVNGISVTTDGSTQFEDGSAGVVLGARVEVEGNVANGVLQARKVELEDDDDGDDDRDEGYEFGGVIGELNTTARTFVIRGQLVSYAGTVRYEDGSEATLANAVEAEVKARLAADGSTLVAYEIEFEDD